ncbi:MAG: DUF4091 domain-containing protein [Lentisphaeria bacterium]|nr:DUF4091 domain-containing protein [Lentisphaeria bacterium]
MRQETGDPITVKAAVDAPKGLNVRVRRVGYVPVPHHNTSVLEDPLEMDGLGHIPGYVPDPLFNEDEITLPSHETHAFWFTVTPKQTATPGTYPISVNITPETGSSRNRIVGRARQVIAEATLYPVKLKPRKNFPITNWFYVDSLIDWYKTAQFDERFWELLPAYMKNMADHGQDTILVPVFTPPLDGVKTPSQLLKVSRGKTGRYAFDWSDVKRYIDLAKACGFKRFEWSHFFTQWGVEHAIRIYEDQGRTEKLLWAPDTGATSDVYRQFLGQFLPELHGFLNKEKLLTKSCFHVSDEPHGEKDLANYVAARALLRELAPWMKVMDAMSDFVYSDKTDMPIPSIKTFAQFLAAGVSSWCYYCCGPRKEWLNRLMDTPLPKIAMHGFLFYRWPAMGFLHWGCNYWYKSQTRQLIDPFMVSDGCKWPNWAYGDTFQVYPGPDGPIDSIRWEVFAESLQDYSLLQTLGVDRNDPRLAPLKSFKDFPKKARWRNQLKRQLLVERKGVINGRN